MIQSYYKKKKKEVSSHNDTELDQYSFLSSLRLGHTSLRAQVGWYGITVLESQDLSKFRALQWQSLEMFPFGAI